MLKIPYAILSLVLSIASVARAADSSLENASESRQHWSVGAQVSGLGSDWGGGFSLGTPDLGNSLLGLNLSYQSFRYSGDSFSDAYYSNLVLALNSYNLVFDKLRAYESFGVGALFPSGS